MDDVGNAVYDMDEEIRNTFSDAKTQLKMHSLHVQRAAKQEKKIGEVMEDIRLGREESTVLIVIDYKTRFEPMRFCETCSDLYAKKGMSWHGRVLF